MDDLKNLPNPFGEENYDEFNTAWQKFILGNCDTCKNIRLFCSCFGANPHVVEILRDNE